MTIYVVLYTIRNSKSNTFQGGNRTKAKRKSNQTKPDQTKTTIAKSIIAKILPEPFVTDFRVYHMEYPKTMRFIEILTPIIREVGSEKEKEVEV